MNIIPFLLFLGLVIVLITVAISVYGKKLSDKELQTAGFLSKSLNYIVYSRNPFLQILFVVIVYGGYGVFFVQGYDWLPEGSPHRRNAVVLFILCIFTFLTASTIGPNVINRQSPPSTLQKYDSITSFPTSCTTCEIVRPARSKHCSLCNHCVERFDHHCVWLNSCIGANNYGWFITFTFIHAVLCTYGTYVMYLVLQYISFHHNLFDLTFTDVLLNETVSITFMTRQKFLLYNYTTLWFISLLIAVMAVGTSLFFLYHFLIAISNRTTNEKTKLHYIEKYLKKTELGEKELLQLKINEEQAFHDYMNKPITGPSESKPVSNNVEGDKSDISEGDKSDNVDLPSVSPLDQLEVGCVGASSNINTSTNTNNNDADSTHKHEHKECDSGCNISHLRSPFPTDSLILYKTPETEKLFTHTPTLKQLILKKIRKDNPPGYTGWYSPSLIPFTFTYQQLSLLPRGHSLPYGRIVEYNGKEGIVIPPPSEWARDYWENCIHTNIYDKGYFQNFGESYGSITPSD